jgi:hypothetical protein
MALFYFMPRAMTVISGIVVVCIVAFGLMLWKATLDQQAGAAAEAERAAIANAEATADAVVKCTEAKIAMKGKHQYLVADQVDSERVDITELDEDFYCKTLGGGK